jgi:hypothetical protein
MSAETSNMPRFTNEPSASRSKCSGHKLDHDSSSSSAFPPRSAVSKPSMNQLSMSAGIVHK